MLAKSSWRWLTPHGAQLCSLSDQACMRCSCIGASICRAILETHQKRLLRLGYVTFPKRGALPSGWPRFNYDGWASISPYPPGYTMMIEKTYTYAADGGQDDAADLWDALGGSDVLMSSTPALACTTMYLDACMHKVKCVLCWLLRG